MKNRVKSYTLDIHIYRFKRIHSHNTCMQFFSLSLLHEFGNGLYLPLIWLNPNPKLLISMLPPQRKKNEFSIKVEDIFHIIYFIITLFVCILSPYEFCSFDDDRNVCVCVWFSIRDQKKYPILILTFYRKFWVWYQVSVSIETAHVYTVIIINGSDLLSFDPNTL